MSFGALFAKQSKEYALHRPTYPLSLYDAIDKFARRDPGHHRPDLALDLACGSGQASIALADRCEAVIGIDSAPEQLAEAQPHPKVTYVVGSANDIPRSVVADHSCDLVTVAQAFHWFEFQKAFAEISRVLRRPPSGDPRGAGGGVCAVWGYGNPVLENPVANRRLNVDFYETKLGRYWNDRRRHVENAYSEIEAEMRKAFHRVEADRSSHVIERETTIADLVRYVSSWSAYATWRRQHPEEGDILAQLQSEICQDYGVESSDAVVSFRYPIFLLLGASPKSQ